MAKFLERLFNHHKEEPLVQNPSAGLRVVEGTRWRRAGEYSRFYFQRADNPLLYILPVTTGGGFIIHESRGSQIVLRVESQSDAVFEILSEEAPNANHVIFWGFNEANNEGQVVAVNGEEGRENGYILEGIHFSEDRRQLHLPDGTIIFQ